MKVAELIEKRQSQWKELESMCNRGSTSLKAEPEKLARFSELYRSTCADLALAEGYNFPPQTVEYLHRLVALSHNQLYRSSKFQWQKWYKIIFEDTPRAIFNEPCVHICFIIFWGLFVSSAYLAYDNTIWPGFAEEVVGAETLDTFEEMHAGGYGGGSSSAVGGYILNNAGIGLTCFVTMLFLIPGFERLTFNAIHLGTVIGYLFRPELGQTSVNFKTFVTAHGPLELTAIVLSSGAGLKIGLSWLITGGLSRLESLQKTAREALPIAMCATLLFCLAALVEGLISPTPEEYMPWWVKGCVSVFTSLMLMFYFVILGYPRKL